MNDTTQMRSAARQHAVPLLRQSPEVPGVRQHLQREAEGRRPRRGRAARDPPDPAGAAAVRCRHGRRHGARAPHAQRACLVAGGAATGGRQGNQPRRRAPRAREDGRSLPRASDHGAGGHQPAIRRRAGAAAARRGGRSRASTGRCCRLKGSSSHDYARQIDGLGAVLDYGWATRPSEASGNPVYVRPSVLVIYREDHAFMLDA